jgi:hypothetical protein
MTPARPSPDEPGRSRRRKWRSVGMRIATIAVVLTGYSVVMVNLGFAAQVALAVTMVVCDLAATRISQAIGGPEEL